MKEAKIVCNRKSDQYPLRLPDGMRDEIKNAAKRAEHSMNAEIITRLMGATSAQRETLRDHFAACALPEAINDYDRVGRSPNSNGESLLPYATKAVGTREEIIARQAYRYADAMLKAREAA
ncbi:Arc family DNA-binding protein [Roseibium sp. RKSG952]|uniref:Arc family DNA-binding protein n=1 Tax=Roseibium sp. RKSG952 TaxID=2529384 RepID=UPI0012BC6B03|nr:Arc family DNA-binding protein [Roseibium sp. RKSG952]MTH96550.1 Arc family DNA-binding protein [Roseibium sp. RKSG952]